MRGIVAKNIDKKIAENLKKSGFELMYTEAVGVLPGLRFHPDMQIALIDKYAVCEPSVFEKYEQFISESGLIPVRGKTTLGSNYPDDIAYNISVVSDYVFHNTKYTDCEVLACGEKKTFIDVRQGYCGCSICKVGKNAVITADLPIYKACKEHGIDALLISSGNIRLDGFDYGFIGGASFCFKDNVYFFGDVSRHPDYSKIKEFCEKHSFGVCPLSDDILSDYGSLLILD